MSLQFSDTSTNRGIIQLIDANVKTNSSSYTTAEKTRDINLAYDRVMSLIFSVGGRWQWDDSNHTGHPILTTDIQAGQRDYAFVNDSAGNLILEIYKVFVADSQGDFREIYPVDVQSGTAPSNYYDGNDTTGIPNTYDKTGSSIFLDPIPNYDRAEGLKIYINREGSYFTTSDTTKKAGFAGIYHEYLALRPSYQYAYRNGLPNANQLEKEMLKMEQDIMDYYKAREKDNVKRMTAAYRCSH